MRKHQSIDQLVPVDLVTAEGELTQASTNGMLISLGRAWWPTDSRSACGRYDPTMGLVLLHALRFDRRMWDTTRPMLADPMVPTLYGLSDSIQESATAILDDCRRSTTLIVVGSSVGGSCTWRSPGPSPRKDRRDRTGRLQGHRSPRSCVTRCRRRSPAGRRHQRRMAQVLGTTVRPQRCTRDSCGRPSPRPKQNVSDIIRGVRAFHDRPDHAEFVSTWTRHLVVVTGADRPDSDPGCRSSECAGGTARAGDRRELRPLRSLEQPDMFHAILTDQCRRMQQA